MCGGLCFGWQRSSPAGFSRSDHGGIGFDHAPRQEIRDRDRRRARELRHIVVVQEFLVEIDRHGEGNGRRDPRGKHTAAERRGAHTDAISGRAARPAPGSPPPATRPQPIMGRGSGKPQQERNRIVSMIITSMKLAVMKKMSCLSRDKQNHDGDHRQRQRGGERRAAQHGEPGEIQEPQVSTKAAFAQNSLSDQIMSASAAKCSAAITASASKVLAAPAEAGLREGKQRAARLCTRPGRTCPAATGCGHHCHDTVIKKMFPARRCHATGRGIRPAGTFAPARAAIGSVAVPALAGGRTRKAEAGSDQAKRRASAAIHTRPASDKAQNTAAEP